LWTASRTDPLTRAESFSYDLDGRLISWTDRKSQVTTYQYDALERQTLVRFGTTGTPPTYASSITRTFDAGDRATEIDDSVGGTITRTYDLLDRLTQEETAEGTIDYSYDAAARRSTMTVDGQTTIAYTYVNADRLTGITQGSASVSLAYDNADRRTSLTLPNGIVVEYGYDDASQLTDLAYKLGGSTFGSLGYAYDADGRRIVLSGTYARSNLPLALTSATYDDANQIATFGHDVHLRRQWESDVRREQDLYMECAQRAGGISGAVSASFAYDGFGRRRSKAIGSATTQFLYDGLNPVQELLSGRRPPISSPASGLTSTSRGRMRPGFATS
jgi:YD repeat-containing protein